MSGDKMTTEGAHGNVQWMVSASRFLTGAVLIGQ